MATTQANEEQSKKTTLEITGMTCASCSSRIEKNLAKLPGVLRANVNLASEKATVEYDPSGVDEGKMVALVKDLGYGVKEEEEKVTFGLTGMTCASCSTRVERTLRLHAWRQGRQRQSGLREGNSALQAQPGVHGGLPKSGQGHRLRSR